jgi:uncharacterized repeat protein (TIGR01451 family)
MGVVVSAKRTRSDVPAASTSLANHSIKTNPVPRALFNSALVPQPPVGPTVTTYAGDCATPQTTFAVGDTVCVKVSGVTLSSPARQLALINANDTVIFSADITSDPQTNTFTVPATTTFGNISVDNRGTWFAAIFNPFLYYSEGTSSFSVADPHNPTADNGVSVTSINSEVQSGSQVIFSLQVKNYGPDNSANVQLASDVPANTTFVSFQQVSGPTFVCNNPDPMTTGTTTCTISTFNWPGPEAIFTAIYKVNDSVANGTQIVDTATVSADTDDQNSRDNSSASASVINNGPTGTSCSFDCPENIVTTATSQNGAVVTFPSAINLVGACGAVSASPKSGSVFPVGTTLVNVTSDAGPSCSFTVTVSDTPAPTITCPPDQAATADQTGTATVNVGTPTTTPSTGVSVTFERSDGAASVTDPFPTGTTGITWTVTDSIGRKASCTQTITVHPPCASDAQPPTITAPSDITTATGPNSTTCGVVLDADQLGQPVVTDDCAATFTVSGIPAGNLFPIGTTTLTYTATDGSGHTASAVQHITVSDNTPPVIFAPADASYTCPEQVPALSASQAFGPSIIVNNQEVPGPVFDNCGVQSVTASETRSGVGSLLSPLVITRTYTAIDVHNNSASAVQIITVTDGTPPTITAPPDVTAYTGPNATTCDTVVSNAVLGTASAQDNCAGVTVSRSPSGNTFPVGTTSVVWTARDWAGNIATATQQVTVIDNTPPVITTNGQTPSMWPPNHSYHTFTVTDFVSSVFDNCGGVSVGDVVIDHVTSDEAENGNGSGNTLNDIVIASDCKSVQLRAEREGGGNGRVYTITFRLTDTHGNVTTTTAHVVVPHNVGETAVDSGVHYTVNGTCP